MSMQRQIKRPREWYWWLKRQVDKEAGGVVADYDRPTPSYTIVRSKEPLSEVMMKFIRDLRP